MARFTAMAGFRMLCPAGFIECLMGRTVSGQWWAAIIGACVLVFVRCSGAAGDERPQVPEIKRSKNPTWYEKYQWKAEDFFQDAGVVQLCRAIEAHDVPEMERLVQSGVSVNARGRDNMTPLLWALPCRSIAPFRRLLELGADPNVVTGSGFGAEYQLTKGDCVTLWAARIPDAEPFRLVMQHGGNPNQAHTEYGTTTLISVFRARGIDPEVQLERVRILIQQKADLNQTAKDGTPPAMYACLEGCYAIALLLYQSGANPAAYKEGTGSRTVHVLVRQKNHKIADLVTHHQADFDALVKWLNEHGESYAEAEKEMQLQEESLPRGINYLKAKRERELAELNRNRPQKNVKYESLIPPAPEVDDVDRD